VDPVGVRILDQNVDLKNCKERGTIQRLNSGYCAKTSKISEGATKFSAPGWSHKVREGKKVKFSILSLEKEYIFLRKKSGKSAIAQQISFGSNW
jgi:hypothetical protein